MLGVLVAPSFQVEIDAGAAALDQRSEDLILDGLGFRGRFFRGLKTEAPVGMQAEPAHRQQAVDLGAQLSRRRCLGDHFLEVSNRTGEIPRGTPRPAPLPQQSNAWPVLIRRFQVIQNRKRPGQIVGGFLVTKTFGRTFRGLAEITQRVGKIAAVLEMHCERRRDVGRSRNLSPIRRWI